jgi:hypothetical protein
MQTTAPGAIMFLLRKTAEEFVWNLPGELRWQFTNTLLSATECCRVLQSAAEGRARRDSNAPLLEK